MGLCASCDSQRLSSVPNSPELEFPPKIQLPSWQLTAAAVDTSKEEIGSNSKDSEEPCSKVDEVPIKGIRKLNPRRRRHFFFVKHKPHVTFVSPVAETLDESFLNRRRSSPISTSNKRLHLHPSPIPKPPPQNTTQLIQALASLSDNEANGISFAEEEELSNIMGNNIQKPPSPTVLRHEGNFTTHLVGRSNSSPFGLHSGSSVTKFTSSKSSSSFAGSDIANNNDVSQFHGFSSVSEGILNQSPVLSPATVSQLNASREEKKLLRARFFSESTTSSPPMTSSAVNPIISNKNMSTTTNKFGFTNRPSSISTTLSVRGGNVPVKEKRTFQYQPPPPKHIIENLTVPKLYSVSGVVAPPPPSLSSLTQISHPTFSQAKLFKPPKLAFQRNLVSSPPPPNETETTERSDVNQTETSPTTTVLGIGAAEKSIHPGFGAAEKNHHHGFGWISKPSVIETKLAKPIPTKPFFLFERSGSGFSGVSTGIVTQRRYFFEPSPPSQQRNIESQKTTIFNPINKIKLGDVKTSDNLQPPPTTTRQNGTDRNGNTNGEIDVPEVNVDKVTITTIPISLSQSQGQGQVEREEKVGITEQVLSPLERRSKNEFFYSQLKGSDEEEEKKDVDAMSVTSRTSSGGGQSIDTQRRDFDSGSSRSLIFDYVHGGGNSGSRPRSGRSLSREREPISDSEFLIDDEISDQPQLTFNFNQDSSLVVLSRSSSEESLLPYDVTHHLQIGENGTSDRFNSEERDRDATTSDSAFSDVSSKPPDSLPPLRKPITKSGIGTTTVGKSKIGKINPTGPGSCLPQPKIINRPAGHIPIPSTKKNEEKLRLSVKSTNPTTTIPRPRLPTSNTTTTVTKQLKTPATSTSSQKLRNSISLPMKKGITTIAQKTVAQPITTTNTKTPRGRTSSVSSITSEPHFGPEIITELTQSVAELKGQLLELRIALEETQEIDMGKDNEIERLRLEVEELKRRKCSCGRVVMDMERVDSQLEKGFGNLVTEDGRRGTTNTAVQTESPKKRELSFSGEETDKLGQLVSFRIGGHRSHSNVLQNSS